MRVGTSKGSRHENSIRSIGGALVALLYLSCLPVLAGAPRLLVYQKNGKGFVHDNLAASATTIQELGREHSFSVDASTDATVFADATLRKYAALIFANSNNEAFDNDEQRAAFQRYIRAGGGFVGLHSSTGSERSWNYFQQMQGAKFFRHSPMQKFRIHILDSKHPATAHLKGTWLRTDECYFFTNVNPSIRVLLAADTTTLEDAKLLTAPGEKVGGVFPLAWCQEFEGARVFYTSLGHKIEHYADPTFRRHLLGGIRWVLGQTNLSMNPLTPSVSPSGGEGVRRVRRSLGEGGRTGEGDSQRFMGPTREVLLPGILTRNLP